MNVEKLKEFGNYQIGNAGWLEIAGSVLNLAQQITDKVVEKKLNEANKNRKRN